MKPISFYFSNFEERRPPLSLENSLWVEFLWQIFSIVNLVLGAWYIHWRWCYSLNFDALWFALPLAFAETCSYIGLILFTFNLWKVQDTLPQPPPQDIRECVAEPKLYPKRPLSVDIFLTTYNEDPELVCLSIRDTKKIYYPYPIDLQIYVLDDGRRSAMKKVAEEEGVHYITRNSNIGFKAGNLAHAMEQTGGDFIVICDADTRPFPTLLEHTLGYFRDPKVVWVQTPQWFYDIPQGYPFRKKLKEKFGIIGLYFAQIIEYFVGPIQIGYDPLNNDPKMFYDIILRRRNWANASFCCGAASIHRRDAVMESALKGYADTVKKSLNIFFKKNSAKSMEKIFAAKNIPISPYKYHVSEDIYTSIILHSDCDRHWKSVFHPEVESKMLSPQDLHSWMVQRFKYAGGTLDIMLRNLALLRSGLSLSQKLMYGATFWSYLGGIWNLIFLLAPIVYLFTAISPVSSYTPEFFKHILPFLILSEIAFMLGTWGISDFKGRIFYLASFTINIKALYTILKGGEIKFPITPKERQEGNFFYLVLPQCTLLVLTLIGLVYAWIACLTGLSYHNLGAVIINTFWGGYNIIALSFLIRAAFWKPHEIND